MLLDNATLMAFDKDELITIGKTSLIGKPYILYTYILQVELFYYTRIV